jgi:2'-5' RNA ligase
MARPIANLRLFVAAYPPERVAAALLEEVSRIDLPPCRVTAIDQVHLTLQFIGDMPATEMDATVESVERAAAGLKRFELEARRMISLPERGPARLVAAELSAPAALLELQRRLASRLAGEPRSRPGDAFRPHMTLCRFRSPSLRGRIDLAVPAESFTVTRVALMKSLLRAEGAVHQEVAGIELGA